MKNYITKTLKRLVLVAAAHVHLADGRGHVQIEREDDLLRKEPIVLLLKVVPGHLLLLPQLGHPLGKLLRMLAVLLGVLGPPLHFTKAPRVGLRDPVHEPEVGAGILDLLGDLRVCGEFVPRHTDPVLQHRHGLHLRVHAAGHGVLAVHAVLGEPLQYFRALLHARDVVHGHPPVLLQPLADGGHLHQELVVGLEPLRELGDVHGRYGHEQRLHVLLDGPEQGGQLLRLGLELRVHRLALRMPLAEGGPGHQVSHGLDSALPHRPVRLSPLQLLQLRREVR
mmetsp:Transcript_4482/g.15713  ORF Transcript_4482/g.15713 Transcript_4482/m.15713 type:complete len:281 (-) Transcript_4482:688-1530(-)